MTRRKPRPVINPLQIIAWRKAVDLQQVAALQLRALCHLDLLVKGKAEEPSVNTLMECIIALQVMGAETQHRQTYDLADRAIVQLVKACDTASKRQLETLQPSTDQRRGITSALRRYVTALPRVPAHVLQIALMTACHRLATVQADSRVAA